MEFFPDRGHVRLRSRVDGTPSYLHADEDGWGVSLSPHRASLNTAWAVHLLPPHPQVDATPYVLLHSAAYGRYLGVRNDYDADAAPPQGQGQGQGQGQEQGQGQGQANPAVLVRMVQCLYDLPLPAQTDILWEARTAQDGGGGVFVLLRQPGHQEGVDRIEVHCTVEAIPRRPAPPQLPDQIPNGAFAPVELSRMIRYIRADNYGIFIMSSRGTLQFEGRSLHCLRGELANQLNDNNITLCVRAGFLGRITPLVIDLPFSEEMMDIVVLTTGSAAATELRHPNVDAA